MKLLWYILPFPLLLVYSYSFCQQKLIQLPSKVMEYTEGFPPFLPVAICPSYTLEFSNHDEESTYNGKGTYTRKEKNGKVLYQRFYFNYSKNKDKNNIIPVHITDQIDSTYFYMNDSAVIVFFNWVSKFEFKLYRMSGIVSITPQQGGGRGKHYFIRQKGYYGNAYKAGINPRTDTITVHSYNDTLTVRKMYKKSRQFVTKFHYDQNGLLVKREDFTLIKKVNNNKRGYYQKLFPSAITYEYTWEKGRLVKLKIGRSNYYTDYRFEYIDDNVNDANSNNSKIVITEEKNVRHSHALIYQPDVSSIKLKLTIKIKDGYMSSFVAERPYYNGNHIISKGTFSCTYNN